MFKMSFLRMRTNSALKKKSAIRASIPYKHAKSIGIIFSVEDRLKHDQVKDFVRHLEQDGKKVQVLEFLPKKKENYEFLYDFFTVEDLSFWGKINSEKATRFSNTPFDYLFYIDTEHNPLVLDVLARSKAACRIGKSDGIDSEFFEFMIQDNGPTKSLIDNFYKYTQSLR
jgi:hypothetical protein